MTFWFFLYILFIVSPISTFIHEFGHVYGAKTVKAESITLSIGLGRKLITIPVKRFQLTIHAFFFLGGFVRNRREVPFSRGEMIIITIFGPLNNGIFTLFFYGIYQFFPNQYILVLVFFNLWLAIVNIIPFKLWGRESDGFIIFREISEGLHKT